MSSDDSISQVYSRSRTSRPPGAQESRAVLARKYKRPTALEIRHEAALELLQRGEISPEAALAAVVWPDGRLADENVPVGRQYYPEEIREEIRGRHAAGESLPALERQTGISLGTLKAFCAHGENSVANAR